MRTLILTAAAALVGFAAVYVTLGGGDNAGKAPAGPPAATSVAAAPGKLNVGEVAGFVFKAKPEPLGEVQFTDRAGKPRTLAEWKGRVVLLNLWATWCAPCRKEMPGLARLHTEMGSNRFEVLALAVDRAGPEVASKFLASVGADALGLYIDTTARANGQLRAVGLPTTILIDAEGREIGRLTGPAEWDTPDAKRLIAAHLK